MILFCTATNGKTTKTAKNHTSIRSRLNILKFLSAFALVMLLGVGNVWGQTTIASDGLNNATTLFTLSGGAYYTGNSASGDRPATSAFASQGTHSRGVISGTATLTSSDINTTGYSSIQMTVRVAAFSIGSTGNGMDGTDILTVEVSPNGGTNYYSTCRILGNNNAYWAYGATGNASTAYDGNATPVDFTPAGGGSRTTDGYSTMTITGLPSSSNMKIKITMLNNASAEQWVIDDFNVTGTAAATAPTITSPTVSSISTTSATLGATVSSDGGATLTERGTVWGTTATPTGNSLAEGGTSVAAFTHSRTGLTANTAYTYRGYATNTAGTGYSADGTFTTLPLEPTVGTGNSISSSGFTANWSHPTMGSASYTYSVEVDDDIAFGSINSTVSSIASSNTSQAITSLSSSTTYYFRIKAINAQGSSVWSSTSAGVTTSSAATPTLNPVTLSSSLSSTYGTASTGVSFTASGSNLTGNITATAQSGYEVSTSSGSGYGASVSVASGATVYVRFPSTRAAGTYNSATAVVLSGGGASSSANVTTSSSGNTVSQKALTVTGLTAQNKTYDGLTTATATGAAALSGVVGADVVSLTGTPTFTFVNATVGNSKTVNTTNYSLTGAQAGNYTLTQPTLSANITVRSLTITANNVSKVQGVLLSGGAGSTAFTSSGLQNSETIGSVTITYGSAGATTGDGNTVGVYASQVTPSAATDGTFTASNYSISYVAGSITVLTTPIKIAGWDFNGLSGYGSSPQTATNSNSNVTIGGLTRASGFGTGGTAATNAWGGDGGNGTATFTVKANSGYTLSLSEISAYNVRRSNTGATTGQWAYSLDGTNFTNIGSAITWGSTTTSAGNSQSAISLLGISALQNLSSATTVTFRIVNSGGTTGTWYLNHFQSGDDFIVQGVVSCPTTSISAHPSTSAASTCLNGTAFSALSVTATGTDLSYQWESSTASDFSTSVTNVGTNSNSYTPVNSATGTLYYRCVVTNGCGVITTSNVSGARTVISSPSAPSAGNTTRCGTGTVAISATPSTGETIDWYGAASGGSILTTGLPSPAQGTTSFTTPSISSTASYYAQARNSTTGCVSPTRTTVIATINSLPAISISASPANAITCQGSSITLTATAGLSSYAWSSGASTTNTAAFSPTATTTYTVTGTDGNGCMNTASQTVNHYPASSYVGLSPSNVSGAMEQCTESNGWTYYATSGAPSQLLFAIKKNGNTINAAVDITINGGSAAYTSTSSNGANQEHGSYLLGRYWNVICTGCTYSLGGGVDVRFFYDPAEITNARSSRNSAFSALKTANASSKADTTASLEWFKTNSVVFAPSNFTGNRLTVAHTKLTGTLGTLNSVNYVEFAGISSFSGGGGGFGFGPPGGAVVGLPVTWAYFTAQKTDGGNQLDWGTASEKNTSHFEIEYSIDGSHFIAMNDKINAAGNSAHLLEYRCIHKLSPPLIYYRIKQVDLDGLYDYSKTIILKNKDVTSKNFIKVLPSYVQSQEPLTIQGYESNMPFVFYEIINGQGQRILSDKISTIDGYFHHSPSLEMYPTGLYYLRVFNSDLNNIYQGKIRK